MQAKHTKAEYLQCQVLKPTVPTHSARWDAFPSLTRHIVHFPSMLLPTARIRSRIGRGGRSTHADHTRLGRYMDVPRVVSWLSSRQYAPEGGFSGRTNKLVDGCYSHWVGGCWPLIQASLSGPSEGEARSADQQLADIGSLFSRNGLIRYILCCCQDMTRRGGLRDKPSKYEFLFPPRTLWWRHN